MSLSQWRRLAALAGTVLLLTVLLALYRTPPPPPTTSACRPHDPRHQRLSRQPQAAAGRHLHPGPAGQEQADRGPGRRGRAHGNARQAAARQQEEQRVRRRGRPDRREPAAFRPVPRRADHRIPLPDGARDHRGRQPRVRRGQRASCCACRTAAAIPSPAAAARARSPAPSSATSPPAPSTRAPARPCCPPTRSRNSMASPWPSSASP